jgi:hypothetical protein
VALIARSLVLPGYRVVGAALDRLEAFDVSGVVRLIADIKRKRSLNCSRSSSYSPA